MPEPRKFRPAWSSPKPNRSPYEDSADRKESQAFYQSREWKQLRDQIRQREPLCRECLKEGRVTLGQAIDHIKPRRQHPELALDPDNLQNLCRLHHNSKRKSE